MTPIFINVKIYDVDKGNVARGDFNSCDVERIQKVIRNNSDVENSTAPTTGLNSLKATNEKAPNPSRDGVDQ